MSIVQLPTSAVIASPHRNRPEVGPLANLLSALMSSHANGLPYDLVSPVMQSCLAMASAHPFDINERVPYVRGATATDFSLLESVLNLTNFNVCAHVYRPWPSSIDGFGPHLLEQPGSAPHRPLQVDTEWVAAVLVAMGANPWSPDPAGDLPRPVQMAAENGMAGLVDRFLACPGSWSAQAIADAAFLNPQGQGRSGWVVLTERSERSAALEVLLKNGARLTHEPTTVELLSAACPEAVETLAPYLQPLSAAGRKKLESAWRARAQSHGLNAEGLGRMSAALWGGDAAEQLSAAAVAIAQDLAVAWGSSANGSSSRAYDFGGNQGIEALVSQGKVKTGPMAGQWSRLASMAFSRVRQASSSGALGWSVENMMFRKFEQGTGWVAADSSQPPYKGALAPALGFDWRPGIAIDSLVMLALLGQQPEASTDHDIQAFSNATGIADLKAWAREHVAGAVEVTKLACSGNATTAAQRMLYVWHALMERTLKAKVLDELSPQHRFDLLYAVTGKFKASDPWSTHTGALAGNQGPVEKFQALVGALFPNLPSCQTLLRQDPEGLEFRVALMVELACSRSSEKHEALLKDLALESARLPEEVFGLLETWAKAATHLTSEASSRCQTMIQGWRLDRRLSPAEASPSARSRPRF